MLKWPISNLFNKTHFSKNLQKSIIMISRQNNRCFFWKRVQTRLLAGLTDSMLFWIQRHWPFIRRSVHSKFFRISGVSWFWNKLEFGAFEFFFTLSSKFRHSASSFGSSKSMLIFLKKKEVKKAITLERLLRRPNFRKHVWKSQRFWKYFFELWFYFYEFLNFSEYF